MRHTARAASSKVRARIANGSPSIGGMPRSGDVLDDRVPARGGRYHEEKLGAPLVRERLRIEGGLDVCCRRRRHEPRVAIDLGPGRVAASLRLSVESERVAARLGLDEDSLLRMCKLQRGIRTDEAVDRSVSVAVELRPDQARKVTRTPPERPADEGQLPSPP